MDIELTSSRDIATRHKVSAITVSNKFNLQSFFFPKSHIRANIVEAIVEVLND